MAIQTLCPFLIRLFALLLLSYKGSLHILDTSPLSDRFANFFPFERLSFHHLDGILWGRVFNFDEVWMLLLSYLRHHYLTEGHKDLLTYFLLRVFILSVLVFRIKIIYVLDTEMDETKYVNGNAGGHMHTYISWSVCWEGLLANGQRSSE